ncbi:MAG: superoxide dismutase family protein [Fusicatenibacter sp.]|nr:superoxide dismutase family protein [Lachnospiraceae bacterium]MDY2938618.1 superoxide dismutase family protein [Fusicatenibacter sp.]
MNLTAQPLSFVNLQKRSDPDAFAWIRGLSRYPNLYGILKCYETPYGGILFEAEVMGLPEETGGFSNGFHGFHIHEYGDCSGDFSGSGMHYNPGNTEHPYHAGDLPPLLANQGYAWMAFYDNRARLDDLLGKSIIIHAKRDDFTTQPSGDSGEKIACGIIGPMQPGIG